MLNKDSIIVIFFIKIIAIKMQIIIFKPYKIRGIFLHIQYIVSQFLFFNTIECFVILFLPICLHLVKIKNNDIEIIKVLVKVFIILKNMYSVLLKEKGIIKKSPKKSVINMKKYKNKVLKINLFIFIIAYLFLWLHYINI